MPDHSAANSPTTTAEEQTHGFSKRYALYVLLMLTLLNTFSFIDRQILAVLIVPIKAEFGVSDMWLGLLTGMAFIGVYVVAGIPLARWADRSSRRLVITVSLVVWSLATTLSGFARNFMHLFLFRMMVGIGEAGGSPPSHSLITDYFSPARRVTALAVFGMGVHIGIMFGYIVAGWVSEFFGWRMTFFVVGIPGLLLAYAIHKTVKEPPRDHLPEPVNILEVVKYLFSKPAFVFLMAGASCHAFAAYGLASWGPTFFDRVHNMSLSSIGTWLGLISGGGGMIGALLGGVLADYMGARNIRWWAYTTAIAALFSIPPGIAVLLSGSGSTALWFYLPYIMLVGVYPGALYAMVQGLAQARMRATAAAIHLFLTNLIGGGIGPLVVGILNDYYRSDYGDHGIVYSLLAVMVCGNILAFLFYMLTSRYLANDLEPESGH